MMSDRGVAVLGGTFDPVHYGHIKSAVAVRKRLGVAEVRLIPAFAPPHRVDPESSPADRLAMLRIAARGHRGVVVDDREIRREGISYTVDTLQSLRKEVGPSQPIYFVLGMDAYRTLNQWYEWRRIATLAHVVVLRRPGHARPDLSSSVPAEVGEWAEARRPDGGAGAGASGCVYYMELEQMAISATEIRGAFHRGEVPRQKLPDAVIEYIDDHGLYRPRHTERELCQKLT